ncbi:LysR family transcriptional regulator [Ruegeria meonggei]|uniref:LysR family transcriptional regulator n=1 Tax=Ruegeria meonggei TaxID=1446476 RepID=UPI00366DE1D0
MKILSPTRSQSATSLQIKRLEAILGQPVFDKHGRGVVLRDTGRKLFPVAQEVTARLDAAPREISQNTVSGKLRLGIHGPPNPDIGHVVSMLRLQPA